MATLHGILAEPNLSNGGKLISDSINELPKPAKHDNGYSRQGLYSRSASFPQRASKSPFFVRHNPHPKKVIHLKGLLDVPVCTVIDDNSHEDPGRFLVRTPTIPTDNPRPRAGFRVPLNSHHFVACKEKAVPGIGLVPITQTWREELANLTEAAGLRKRHPNISKTGLLQPPSSRQSERPSISRQAVNGEVPPSRNGEKPATPAPNGVVPPSRQASRQAATERPLEHIISMTDCEGWVLETLCNILQTDSVHAVQSWLVNAPGREKELVLDMIRAISSSDYEFRESYNNAVRSPDLYDDQLLQHESSLDVDAINAFNGTNKKKKNEGKVNVEERHEEPPKELQKPRTPASPNGNKYEWTAVGCKPSSPFKPRPGTSDAEIEEIRTKLESRASARVFSHQNRAPPSRHSPRPATQQSVFVPPAASMDAAAQRPPSHQSIKSQQNALRSILEYKPEKE